MKEFLKRVPVVGALGRATMRLYRNRAFQDSTTYWKTRYNEGGNSGRGSYGPFAEFKAEVLNGLVQELGITSLIEFGCGDGAQLTLAAYPRYTGLDVSPDAVRLCGERFSGDRTKSFLLYDPSCFYDRAGVLQADAGLSLDVIYHLTEDRVFETYMTHLFATSARFVILYSNDSNQPSPTAHVRYRRFSDWIRSHAPAWSLLRHIPNRYPFTGDDRTGSPSDFYVYRRAVEA